MGRPPVPPPLQPFLVEIYDVLLRVGVARWPLRKVIEYQPMLDWVAEEGRRRAVEHRRAAKTLRERIDRLEPWMVSPDMIHDAKAHEIRAHQLEHLA